MNVFLFTILSKLIANSTLNPPNLGYSSSQKGNKCYCPINKKCYNSMDVTFFEEQPFYPKTDVQGENYVEEHLFWSYLDFSSPSNQPMPTASPPSHPVPTASSPS